MNEYKVGQDRLSSCPLCVSRTTRRIGSIQHPAEKCSGRSDDSAAGSAGPPGSRRRRRCRCGPQDPRTPHPATAPPSSGAAAEGSPAATTHGPVTSGVARCTSRPALSCARSPPPVGSGTRRGRALTQSAARGPRGSESAPAQWLAAPTHARLHTPAQ